MRYQERIYIQNDNRAVRNRDLLNVNMSSDICIFKSPLFGVSGGTVVPCGQVTCDLTDVSLNDIFSAVTATCYTSATSICHSATTWETKYYVDSELESTRLFYSGTTYGTIPTKESLLNSVTLSLIDLGISFKRDGQTFIIDKPYGVKTLEMDVCVSITMDSVSEFTCPPGFSATPANDACQKISVSAATFTGAGPTIQAGDKDVNFSTYGTFFYPSLSGQSFPLSYTGNFGSLVNAIGQEVPYDVWVSPGNTFWCNFVGGGGTLINGRLNNCGLSADTSQWLGFSKCIDILSAGTYYVGVGADNQARVKINGQLVINFTGSTLDNFRKWSVFPFYFNSGVNIIEMEGRNVGSASAFGAEIYNPVDFATLTAATNTGATGLIFSTAEFIGENWQLGETFGYSCPSGYALDTCTSPFTCVQIITTGITTGCTTPSCLDNCVVVCSQEFPFVENGSQGVHILSDTATTIPFTFTFTGNLDTITSSTSFKYEVYRYLSDSKVFKLPSVYKSELFPYTSFSATSALTVSIPTASLNLDGEYIIKGYFETDVCTDFLSRLGKKIDTSIYKSGDKYGLYVPETDTYFLAIKEADTPIFNGTGNNEVAINPFSLYQQVIIVDFNAEQNGPSDPEQGLGYERTGSTFTLTSEFVGDVLLTLNGLTLAKNIDYTLSGQTLTFFGPIANGDVISIYFTRTTTATLTSNSILIDTTIPSGATNTQGTNNYFYNTTTGKYEVYTTNQPLSGTKIIVSLNGVTLVDGIDYYQSVTNPNRIILNGDLMVGDIITIIYFPSAAIINGVSSVNSIVGWSILNGPTLQNGFFTLEYSDNTDFEGITISDTVPYQINVTDYTGVLTLTGSAGTNLYYRVKNTKNYVSMCGDEIQTVAYSEIVPITIESNSINSY